MMWYKQSWLPLENGNTKVISFLAFDIAPLVITAAGAFCLRRPDTLGGSLSFLFQEQSWCRVSVTTLRDFDLLGQSQNNNQH